MSASSPAPVHSAWNNPWGPRIPPGVRREADRAGLPFTQLVRLVELYVEENPAEGLPGSLDELVDRVLL